MTSIDGHCRLYPLIFFGSKPSCNCDLGPRNFFGGRPSWKATGPKATIAIWELEVWWRAQLEGDRAATAICELVVLLVADEGDSYNCYLGTGVLGGRLSLKMGYNCNLGSRGFLCGWAGPFRLQCETWIFLAVGN